MAKKKIFIISIFLVSFCFPYFATSQSAIDLRINEFLVQNDSNYVDDFGMHSPWVEIFNSAYNMVDVGGLYLTDDLSNPTKYSIAKGQPITQIPPRSYIVFWLDNHETRGILHANFDLRDSKLIALFDANGKTLIDSVSVLSDAIPNKTYGRLEDAGYDWGYLSKASPKSNNNTNPKKRASDIFGEMDPSGIGMAIIAMFVVFSALALLFVFFKNMSRALEFKWKPKVKTIEVDKDGHELSFNSKKGKDEMTGEVNAAIAMALYLYRSELHDYENTVLTINKVSRTYSPWSSKIYGLRQNPR